MTYNHVRANIRNAWFCEPVEAILAEWKVRIERGDRESAGYLRELLNEALDELEA